MSIKIVELGKSRDNHNWMRCNFCFEKKPIMDLRFTRHDGNGHLFHICDECVKQLKDEVNKLNVEDAKR